MSEPNVREDLKRKATELGLKVPRNTSDETLAAMVAEAETLKAVSISTDAPFENESVPESDDAEIEVVEQKNDGSTVPVVTAPPPLPVEEKPKKPAEDLPTIVPGVGTRAPKSSIKLYKIKGSTRAEKSFRVGKVWYILTSLREIEVTKDVRDHFVGSKIAVDVL